MVSSAAVAQEKVFKSNCTLCVNSCGIDVYVKGGKIERVQGMKEHPLNKGVLCPRGQAIVDWQDSPDRLLHPLKKHNGAWKRITWDEALDLMASKFEQVKREDGARALAVQVGAIGGEDRENTWLARRFCAAYGTPNFLEPGICYTEYMRGRMITFGRFPFEEPENSKCILLWGHNPSTSDPAKARRVLDAVRAGAQLVVINPKRIPLAAKAIYLSPRPGTDLPLVLGLLNVIISEGIWDKEFVSKWTIGFEALREHVKQYPPEKVAGITGVPAEDIKKVARLFAQNKPSVIIQGTRTFGQQFGGLQISRGFSILQSITGNVYQRGTWIRVPQPRWTRLELKVNERPVGAEEYPLYDELWGRFFGAGQGLSLPDAVLEGKPYPIKAVIFLAGNFVITQPDSLRFKETFEKLDFLAVVDVRMNETAQLATLVLPAATFLEKTGLGYSYAVTQGIPYISLRPKVVEPPEECWSEFKIWSELARRMGLGEYFPFQTEEDFVNWELKDAGLSVEELKSLPSGGLIFSPTTYGEDAFRGGFPTPSGKIELYSETMQNYGLDPLPTYGSAEIKFLDDPEGAKEFPLILISGSRDAQYTHSQMREISRLHKRTPEALAEVHPDTAKAYGLSDGDMARVETKKAGMQIKLKTTADLLPGVVSIPHGWAQANVNLILDMKIRDKGTGLPQLQAIRCRLKKG